MNRSTDLKGAHGTKTMLDLERASQISKGATQKQPDAWSEGVPLPLAFESYATKVFCSPWYWNRGPARLSSQGVLQSDETKI